jgi:hypothetical protein
MSWKFGNLCLPKDLRGKTFLCRMEAPRHVRNSALAANKEISWGGTLLLWGGRPMAFVGMMLVIAFFFPYLVPAWQSFATGSFFLIYDVLMMGLAMVVSNVPRWLRLSEQSLAQWLAAWLFGVPTIPEVHLYKALERNQVVAVPGFGRILKVFRELQAQLPSEQERRQREHELIGSDEMVELLKLHRYLKEEPSEELTERNQRGALRRLREEETRLLEGLRVELQDRQELTREVRKLREQPAKDDAEAARESLNAGFGLDYPGDAERP